MVNEAHLLPRPVWKNLCFCGAAQALSAHNIANWIPPQSQLEGRVIKIDVCACVAGTTLIYLSRRWSYFQLLLHLSDDMHAVHTQVPMDSRCACYSQVGSRATYLVTPWPLYVTERLAFTSALLLWGGKCQACVKRQEVERTSPNRLGFILAT